jgi:hypothetical protein
VLQHSNEANMDEEEALAFRSCQLVDDGRPVTMHLWLLMRAGLRGGGPYLSAMHHTMASGLMHTLWTSTKHILQTLPPGKDTVKQHMSCNAS